MSKRAFSLIELMVVISVAMLIAIVALPAYKEYSTKAKVTSVMPLLENLKLLVTQYRDLSGEWPNDIEDIGLDFDAYDNDMISQIDLLSAAGILNCNNFSPSAYSSNMCIAIELNSGIVPNVPNPVLLLLATDDGDLTTWQCVTANSAFANNHIPAAYLPGGCAAS